MFKKIVHKEVEELFLFLRGVRIHLYNKKSRCVSKIMREDYISVISKYITHYDFDKPSKNTNPKLIN